MIPYQQRYHHNLETEIMNIKCIDNKANKTELPVHHL